MAQSASADSQSIQESVQDVSQCFETLTGVRNNLQSYAEEAASKWAGESAEVFKRVMQSADEKLSKIGEALDELGQKLGGAAMAYQSGEEENAQVASNIENLLSGL